MERTLHQLSVRGQLWRDARSLPIDFVFAFGAAQLSFQTRGMMLATERMGAHSLGVSANWRKVKPTKGVRNRRPLQSAARKPGLGRERFDIT